MWTAKPSASTSEVPTIVQIEDGAALGIARSALKAQAHHATDQAREAIYQFKSPSLAAIWAKNSARYGLAYLQLAEVKFL